MLRATHMHQPYAWTSTALEQYQKRLQGRWSSSEWFPGGRSGMSCMGEVVWQKTRARSTKSFSACPESVVLSARPIQAPLSPSFFSSPFKVISPLEQTRILTWRHFSLCKSPVFQIRGETISLGCTYPDPRCRYFNLITCN